MRTERMGTEAAKALFEVRLDGTCAAPAEAVYGLLVDLEQHLEWGGRRQKRKKFRLTSLEAPAGPAMVGTEFRTTGIDPSGSFMDTSVITEATRPEMFEFVTEARLRRRRGDVVEWTIVHRYEIELRGAGCGVSYSLRVMRLSRPLWCTRRLAKGLAQKISASYVRGGFHNLLRMAEARARSNAAG
jgi:uncharacterized protein YndB with AHSA1/START domain